MNMQLMIAIAIIIGSIVLAVFEYVILPFICMLAVFLVTDAILLLLKGEPKKTKRKIPVVFK